MFRNVIAYVHCLNVYDYIYIYIYGNIVDRVNNNYVFNNAVYQHNILLWKVQYVLYSTGITCTPLSSPNYTEPIVYSSGPNPTNYDYATTATYTCIEGFSMNAGDEIRTCGGDGSSINGTWGGIEPTCSRTYTY